jgi:hypothetical protein
MRTMNVGTARGSEARAVLLGGLTTLGLTAAHHVYGGVVYATPWRLHGAAMAAFVSLVLLLAYFVHRRTTDPAFGRAAGWTLAVGVLVLPVLLTGVVEGAYNHVLKNILFFGGVPMNVLVRMFPPPTYEMPNDALFEISGVAQVVPAAWATFALPRFIRGLPAFGGGKPLDEPRPRGT